MCDNVLTILNEMLWNLGIVGRLARSSCAGSRAAMVGLPTCYVACGLSGELRLPEGCCQNFEVERPLKIDACELG